MAVVSRHIGSRLRMTDTAGEVVQTLHRIRPNINTDIDAVESVMGAVGLIQGNAVTGALLTVTTELGEE